MATHRKTRHRIHRIRARKQKRRRLRAHSVNPDELFSGGFYVGKRKDS